MDALEFNLHVGSESPENNKITVRQEGCSCISFGKLKAEREK